MLQAGSFLEHLAAARKSLELSRGQHYLSGFEESTRHLRGAVASLQQAIEVVSAGGEVNPQDHQVFHQFLREMESADALNRQAGALHSAWAGVADEQLGIQGGYSRDGLFETYAPKGRIAIEA
jgi:hypothetical protein